MARWRRKSLARDTRGTTMIEFAILAPIFFALIMGILETSLQYFAAQVLETGVHDASRSIRVGQAKMENWNAKHYKDEICGRLFGLFGDCADMHINVRQIDNFQSTNYSVPLDRNCKKDCNWTDPESWTPGVASSVMLVQVYYRYPSILQVPFAANELADGRRLLSAATVFRNEPF